jgi:hypothetical protein
VKSFVDQLATELRNLRSGKAHVEAEPRVVCVAKGDKYVQFVLPAKTFQKLTRLAKRRHLDIPQLLERLAEGT